MNARPVPVPVEDLVGGELLLTDESMCLYGYGLPARVRVESITRRTARDGTTYWLLSTDTGERCPLTAGAYVAVLRWETP